MHLADTLKRFSKRENLLFFHANAIKFDGLEEYYIKLRAKKELFIKLDKIIKFNMVKTLPSYNEPSIVS